MFSALVVILLLAGPSLQFTLESADGQASLPSSRSRLERWGGGPGCKCQPISKTKQKCEHCYSPYHGEWLCKEAKGPKTEELCAFLIKKDTRPRLKTQTGDETQCSCQCNSDDICQCQVCPVVDIDDLTEPDRCKTHEGPNLSCSSLQESANLEAHKTQTRGQQIQCSCTDYFNGSWNCRVCVNNSCRNKSGRGRKPAGCSHSWPWRSDNNYHGDDGIRAHKGQSQCNCQCQNGVCHGECCDANGCTSNPGCSRSSLELWSDNNYHGDDLRAHKGLQCQCQCNDDGCYGQCCDENGCTSNPGCSRSSLELWSDNNYHGDDLRAHKSLQCQCQCNDDGCYGQCCDENGCTSNPGCSRSSLELWGNNNYHGDDLGAHKGQFQCNCQCDDDGCHGQCCDANGCTSNKGCY